MKHGPGLCPYCGSSLIEARVSRGKWPLRA